MHKLLAAAERKFHSNQKQVLKILNYENKRFALLIKYFAVHSVKLGNVHMMKRNLLNRVNYTFGVEPDNLLHLWKLLVDGVRKIGPINRLEMLQAKLSECKANNYDVWSNMTKCI